MAQRFLFPLRLPGPAVVDTALSADARSAAALVREPNGRQTVLVWRSGNPGPVATVRVPPRANADFEDSLGLSGDGQLIAVGSADGQVSVWSLAAAEKPRATFDLGRSRVTALTFARQRYVVVAGRDTLPDLSGWLLGAGDASGRVAIWDLGRPGQVMQSRDSHHEVLGLVFSPDATTLYSTGRVECRCWDVASGRLLLTIRPGLNVIPGIALSPSGTLLALASSPMFGGTAAVRLYELESGRGIQDLRGLTGQASRLTVTPDGHRAAGLTQDWQAGVWDVPTGQMLMRVDVPVALYADHCDLRLTDDGRFLVIAGGRVAHRWAVPTGPLDRPRTTDTWDLNPAWTNRLAVTTDGRILLCRNETRGGKDFPHAVPAAIDPRCVRVYELAAGGPATEVTRHDEHAWHVFSILALPDGAGFITDGMGTNAIGSREIIAYPATAGDPLWKIGFPNARFEGFVALDSSGTVMTYADPPDQPRRQRQFPYRGGPDTPSPTDEVAILGIEIVVKEVPGREIGLRLAMTGWPAPFLILNTGAHVPLGAVRFTPDGRTLVWGTADATMFAGDLPRIRELLVAVGFPDW